MGAVEVSPSETPGRRQYCRIGEKCPVCNLCGAIYAIEEAQRCVNLLRDSANLVEARVSLITAFEAMEAYAHED